MTNRICAQCKVVELSSRQKMTCSVTCDLLERTAERKMVIKEPFCLCCNGNLGKNQFKFCTKSCAAKYNNLKRAPRSEESRKKISDILKNSEKAREARKKVSAAESIKRLTGTKNKIKPLLLKCCSECQNLMVVARKKYCTKECRYKFFSRNMNTWLKKSENRLRYKGNSGPSYMENSFKIWLENKGIQKGLNGFLSELHFYNKISGKHGWADFVFPKFRLIIELDGNHHKNRVDLDKIRDDYLRSKGWNVVRITHREYIRGVRTSEIEKLLDIST